MADLTRRYQFTRRNKSIADLGMKSMTTGKFTLTELRQKNIWKVNSVHQIGIATTSEIGLTHDRWPIRVKICTPIPYVTEVDTVCRSWPIVMANNNPVPFGEQAPFDEVRLKRLFKWVPDLDSKLWTIWGAIRANVVNDAYPTDIGAVQGLIREALAVQNPTAAQLETLGVNVATFLNLCRANNRIPKLPLGDGYALLGQPHGKEEAAVHGVPAEEVAQVEAGLTAQFNFNRLKSKYPGIADGTVTMCAYAIANMFRLGLYEQYGGAEYYTVYMAPGTGTNYTVVGVSHPSNAPPPTGIANGDNIDTALITIDPPFIEIGSAFVAMSGVMHYSYNHTTGGSALAGPVLAMALSFGLYDSTADNAAQELQTSLYYEALHPSNKRLIANLLFRNSGVITAGRHRDAPRVLELHVDAFIQIRTNPFPAGAHKAYVAAEVLKRILRANLAPFLPWANEINNCVNACAEIVQSGARAHIGARYYLGSAPVTQGSNLDNYIPDLAAYIQTMAKNDTLAMSPHLGGANAARASPGWVALLRELKSNDISGTDIALVKQYLNAAGQVTFSLTPEDETTWKKAIDDCEVSLNTLTDILG